jgi:pilus assembly protein Flp/PilA
MVNSNKPKEKSTESSDVYWRLIEVGEFDRVFGGEQVAMACRPSQVFSAGDQVMSKFVTRFLKDESGATAIEYGLIIALISVIIVAAFGVLKGGLESAFDSTAETLKNPNP